MAGLDAGVRRRRKMERKEGNLVRSSPLENLFLRCVSMCCRCLSGTVSGCALRTDYDFSSGKLALIVMSDVMPAANSVEAKKLTRGVSSETID